MRSQAERLSIRRRCLIASAAGLVLAVSAAFAQEAAPPPQEPAVQPAPAPQPPPPRPGLFETLGRWIDHSSTAVRDHLRGAKQRVDSIGDEAADNSREIGKSAADVGKSAVSATRGAVEATKSAVDTVTKLSTARIMEGHERCDAAPNGAPDCVAAASALCRKHGYSSGKSVDFTSAEECPPRAYLAGRSAPAECTTVTFISRAMCQ